MQTFVRYAHGQNQEIARIVFKRLLGVRRTLVGLSYLEGRKGRFCTSQRIKRGEWEWLWEGSLSGFYKQKRE